MPQMFDAFDVSGLALLCTAVVYYLFDVPLVSTLRGNDGLSLTPTNLHDFIHHLILISGVHQDLQVIPIALLYLERLKGRFPTARGLNGHAPILAALVLASKAVHKAGPLCHTRIWWAFQHTFTEDEVWGMEAEMDQLLGEGRTVDEWELDEFCARILDSRSRGVPFSVPAGVYQVADAGLPVLIRLFYDASIPSSPPPPYPIPDIPEDVGGDVPALEIDE